jgi:hypothetical protein
MADCTPLDPRRCFTTPDGRSPPVTSSQQDLDVEQGPASGLLETDQSPLDRRHPTVNGCQKVAERRHFVGDRFAVAHVHRLQLWRHSWRRSDSAPQPLTGAPATARLTGDDGRLSTSEPTMRSSHELLRRRPSTAETPPNTPQNSGRSASSLSGAAADHDGRTTATAASGEWNFRRRLLCFDFGLCCSTKTSPSSLVTKIKGISAFRMAMSRFSPPPPLYPRLRHLCKTNQTKNEM